jgi:hypothetical protein
MRGDPSIQLLAHRLQLLESVVAHNEGTHFDLAQPGSELADDDAVLAPVQLSHLVGFCLSLTIDMFRAVHTLLWREPKRSIELPMAAQYPLLRTAAESAALAVWLLAPQDPSERRVRALKARWEDVTQDNQLALALTAPTGSDSKEQLKADQKSRQRNAKQVGEKKRLLLKVAQTAGVPKEQFMNGLPGFGPIVEEAGKQEGLRGTHAVAQWRLISGMTHPSASRSLAASSMEELKDLGDGTLQALFTADPRVTILSIEAAFSHYLEATRLTALRGGNSGVAFSLPKGFPVPPRFQNAEQSDRDFGEGTH